MKLERKMRFLYIQVISGTINVIGQNNIIIVSNEVLASNDENKEKENISKDIEVKENKSQKLKGEGKKGKSVVKLLFYIAFSSCYHTCNYTQQRLIKGQKNI